MTVAGCRRHARPLPLPLPDRYSCRSTPGIGGGLMAQGHGHHPAFPLASDERHEDDVLLYGTPESAPSPEPAGQDPPSSWGPREERFP